MPNPYRFLRQRSFDPEGIGYDYTTFRKKKRSLASLGTLMNCGVRSSLPLVARHGSCEGWLKYSVLKEVIQVAGMPYPKPKKTTKKTKMPKGY